MMRFLPWVGAAALMFLPACGGEQPKTAPEAGPQGGSPQPAKRLPPKAVEVDAMMVKMLFGEYPNAPVAPVESTPELVALGRMLYHDQSLSKNGNQSCATCHDLANYGQDGKPTSAGSDGKNGTRNTPTTLNAFRQYAQFWDYRAKSVEEQAIVQVLSPLEHGLADEAELVGKMKASADLTAAFAKAFGDGDVVTVENFKNAVGAFERTLVTTSRFDKFIDGDKRALTNDEKKGLNTFIEVGCTQCHTSRLLGGASQQQLGRFGKFDTTDKGRAEVTKNEAEAGFFKVPPLLNVAKTAPYHHNGSDPSLANTVKTMGQTQLGKDLTEEEVDSIVKFLEALTGEVPAGVVGAR